MEGISALEKAEREISELLKTASGEKIDICYEIYNKIVSYPGNEPDLLRFFMEESEQIVSNENRPVEVIFLEEERTEYISNYGETIDEILENLIKEELEENIFYKELWNSIDTNIFNSSKLRAFAVYFIWIDMRMPYFKLESGIQMSGEEYRKIRKSIIKEIQRARFIISAPMNQKTERASRLVNMLDSIKDDKTKSVLMTQILLLYGQAYIINEIIKEGGKIVCDEQIPSD